MTNAAPTINHYHKVDSTNILAIGYDHVAGMMDIIFKQDPLMMYRYKNVTPTEYAALMNAPSHGQHFAARIKKSPKLYPFTVHDAPVIK